MQRISLIIVVGLLALTVAGCGGVTAEETATPEVEEAFVPVVSVTGEVVPAVWAMLSFETSGRVTWLVAEGSLVSTGDMLARLDASDLEHTMAQARAALATAQAQLAASQADAAPEEIAAAAGAVVAAQGGVAAAEAALGQAEVGVEIARANLKQAEGAVDAAEAVLAQAQATLDAAEADLTRAQAELARLQAGARLEEIATYQARLAQAEAELRYLTNVHQQLIDNDIGGAPEEQARFQMEAGQAARDVAQAQIDLAKAGATDDEIAAARAGVSAAQAQVSITQSGVDAAEAALVQVQAALEAAQGQVRLAEAGVAAAQAQVEVAEGQRAQAEAQRDRLKAGATAEEIAVLEAQVAQAEAAVAQAESALAKAALVAPFDGTVGTLYLRAGEIVVPGQPLVTLGDLTTLRVETTDLDENDVTRVAVGQQVAVTSDALPERVFPGLVTRISPMSDPGAGGVNYTVVIELDETDPTLRWGMTAFVDIEVGDQ